MESIRWAPKVQPEKIRRLYESESKGLLNEKLLDDVAYAFYVRCRSIIMVTEGRGICPDCQGEYMVGTPCEGCGRTIDGPEFVASYRHMDLYGGTGIEYFRSYVDLFPSATGSAEKMMLIDQLIHAFHRGVLAPSNQSVASGLIEGSPRQVMELLNGITFGKEGQESGYKSEWSSAGDVMMLLRKKKARDGD